MTVADWLSLRSPRPPEALRARVALRLGAHATADAGEARAVCLAASVRIIAALTAGDARARDHAIDLLAADALITYAIEAAVSDTPDLARDLDAMVRELSSIPGAA